MTYLDFKEHNTQTKIFWAIMFGASAAVVGIAIYSVSEYTFSEFAMLFSAVFVTALVCSYELRVPGTKIVIAVGTMISIWGFFSLGASGSVLIGAVGAIALFGKEKQVTAVRSFTAFSRLIAIAAGAKAIPYIFQRSPDSFFRLQSIEDLTVIVGGILAMSMIIAGASYVLDLMFLSFTAKRGRQLQQSAVSRVADLIPVAFLSIALCLPFAYFGVEFGLVVVPITVIAILAYQIHLSRLQQKTAQILDANRVHLSTIEALATAIDARDQITNGHVRRTQIYAVGMGETLDLSENEIRALRTGALLHDIGKLAVPEHILSKPGKLTAAESEKTKIHSNVGASILANIGFSYPVIPTVKHHHESWDGSGYPDGLSGNQIPFTARILAIADAYDTLRSTRPYRPAMSADDARKVLSSKAGVQFDPNLVSVFLKNLRKYETTVQEAGFAYESAGNSTKVRTSELNYYYVEQIKLANKEVSTLFDLAREFSSTANMQSVLDLFTHKIRELVPFDTCAVYLLERSKQFATAVHVAGENSDTLASKRIRVGQGATGVAISRRQLVRNVNPDLDFSLSKFELIQQYSTMAAIPLIANDELIGAVSLYSIDLPRYGDEHLRVMETISGIAAEAISQSLQHTEAKVHALTDLMTGLPNARSLQMQFEKEVGRADRTENMFQVLVMDLDGFKAVNDTYGHKAGDEMLKEISKVIMLQLRDYDFLSRYGGDEFIALIPDSGHGETIELCSRIESAVSQYRLSLEDKMIARVGISVGAAVYPLNGTSFDELIAAADKVMYSKKFARKKQADEPNYPMLSSATSKNGVEPPSISREEAFIVEVDESHIVASTAIN